MTVSASQQCPANVRTLSLRLGLLLARSGVLASPVFLDVARFQHVPLELCCIVNALRNMSLIFNRSYVFDRGPSIDEAFAILDSLTLLGRDGADLVRGL